MDPARSGAPFLTGEPLTREQEAVRADALAFVAAASGGKEPAGAVYVDILRRARTAGMLRHPAVVAAVNWKEWLHPRGKDGRFIEVLSFVNIFANATDRMNDPKAPRRRARIRRLTESGAEVDYYDAASGKVVPAEPSKGFPEKIALSEIHDKVSLAPRHIARLRNVDQGDASAADEWIEVQPARSMREWQQATREFNDSLRTSPPGGRSHNEPGADLTADSTAWEEHQQYVDDVLARALDSGLSSGRFLRDSDGNWSDEAWEYFLDVVDTEVAKVEAAEVPVPKERRAVMLGGLPGAGKTTAERIDVLRPAGLGDSSQWVVVNSDDFKALMVERGDVPNIDGLAPMEEAALIHAQSSEMAHMFGRVMMARGYNVIMDTTMGGMPRPGDVSAPEQDVRALKAHGYSIDSIFVDVTVPVAMKRQKSRQLGGLNMLRRGVSTAGGRTVPGEASKGSLTGKNSQNADNFDKMVASGLLDRWMVIDNSTKPVVAVLGAGSAPVPDLDAALANPSNLPGVKP